MAQEGVNHLPGRFIGDPTHGVRHSFSDAACQVIEGSTQSSNMTGEGTTEGRKE